MNPNNSFIAFILLFIINNVFWYFLGKDELNSEGIILVTVINCIIDLVIVCILLSFILKA